MYNEKMIKSINKRMIYESIYISRKDDKEHE